MLPPVVDFKKILQKSYTERYSQMKSTEFPRFPALKKPAIIRSGEQLYSRRPLARLLPRGRPSACGFLVRKIGAFPRRLDSCAGLDFRIDSTVFGRAFGTNTIGQPS